MEIKITTPVLKKHIGKKIKYRKTHIGEFTYGTIMEIYNRQLNVGNDWISFDKLASIELID